MRRKWGLRLELLHNDGGRLRCQVGKMTAFFFTAC